MPVTTDERDAQTLDHLAAAEAALLAALKSMPNHVDSCFDPARDVRELQGALDRVRDVAHYARETSR